MRHHSIIILCLTAFLLIGKVGTGYAQLVSEGTWNATTINATSSSGTKNPVIKLTGDVSTKGCITVANGYTLTIENESGKEVIIKRTASSTTAMFSVNSGGTLIIKGTKDAPIIIDGGAEFTWAQQDEMPYMTLTPGSGGKMIIAGINTSGTLNLSHVIIQNVNDYNSIGGAINVSSSSGTTLTDCVIRQCRSLLGSAIMINGGGDPEKSAIRITNSTITQCISGGDYSGANTGGAIRTYGSVTSNLYLTNVTMSYNYAMREYTGYNNTLQMDGNGGALFWNGRGEEETACYVDGCLFEHNISDDNGGAIKSQGSLYFVKNPTTIQNNQAPNGAGLYIEGYTGGVTTGVRTIDYDLNENLVVKNNISPAYNHKGENNPGKGAGVHFFFGSGMNLTKGSTINVNMNGATIERNQTKGDDGMGGGVYFENTSVSGKYIFNIKLNHGILAKNQAAYGGGLYAYKGNVGSILTAGKTLQIYDNVATSDGGGVYIKDGNLEMAAGQVSNNEASNYGGGISINGGNFSLQQGKINGNESPVAGGIYMAGGEFTMEDGEIVGNMATTGNGGGLYIENAGSFEMKNGTISGNTAKANGGGICMLDGEVTITEGSIQENTGEIGGGLYVYNSEETEKKASFNGGSILQNKATYGGGACVDGNIELTINKVEINKNEATDGGGLYIRNRASFIMESGAIRENKVTGNGGGICMLDGEVTITDGSIQGNSSQAYGGGLYVYNSDAGTTNTASFSGGIILQNSATYGGGACVDGNIELAITKIQIDQNTAINGGGICLLNNAAMNFGEGLIRNNTAKAKTDGESFGTAKGAMIDKLHGVGGGIYLNDNTSLTFNSPETMGLYGNKADNAADDVFASGQGTKVTLPKVIYMNLTGYSAANGNLFWVEDYVAGDTEYSEGTYINNDKDYVAKRYRVALANSEQVYTVEDGNFDNKYLCLTLGFRVLYAIIKKVGLREGESAIFVVSKKKEDGEYSTYATILFKGETGKAELSKEITISAGTWQVEETDWSWGYKMKAGSSKVIVKENIEKDGEIFEFENEFDATGDKPLKYDEKIKVNVLQM